MIPSIDDLRHWFNQMATISVCMEFWHMGQPDNWEWLVGDAIRWR